MQVCIIEDIEVILTSKFHLTFAGYNSFLFLAV